MKKAIYMLAIAAFAVAFTSCNSCSSQKADAADEAAAESKAAEEGWISLFDGKTFNGWRGYNQAGVPDIWSVEPDGSIKVKGNGMGEGSGKELIYDKKFGNFELELEWKVSKGGNSGIFYLAQEVPGQPIYISAPEYQILDNENHVDARLGANRQAGSLYDMIAADPQNAKPFGEWNKANIIVYKGTVVHFQNGVKVLEYHLWTDRWKDLLNSGKFKQGSAEYPLAFDLLYNAGGEDHAGYIGLQDHGDDVWFRNIRVKDLNQ